MAMAERRGIVLCGLATYPCPHTVRGNVLAQRLAFASEGQGRGRGSTHGPGAPLAVLRAGADVQSPAKGSGRKSRCAPTRFLTPRGSEHHRPGGARDRPGRRAAPPLRSLTRGGTSASRTPCRVCAWKRPPALIDALRWFTRGPYHVCARSRRGMSGPPECSAARAPPLPRRPT